VFTLGLICTLIAGAPAFEAWPGVSQLPVLKELPDPFVFRDGNRVATRDDWNRRRAEIISMLAYYEYGHMPPAPDKVQAQVVSDEAVFEDAARELRVVLNLGPGGTLKVNVGVYIPQGKPGPFPVIFAIEPVWMDHLRPVARKMVERGYIFAGFRREDLDEDNADRSDGVHPLYPGYDWATLAVWAWGCMRVVDYLDTLDAVDKAHIALTGHSRAGKVALLAGALDERIALVAPHGSGAGGAGSYRIAPKGCETLELITQPERFQYWFIPRLRDFAGHEDQLPFDQHFLRALVAPRALVSMDGLDDAWANPLGTQEMWSAAQPVFDFLGAGENNGAYFRPGGHDTTDDDWAALLDFADHYFFGKPAVRECHKAAFPNAPKAFTWKAPAAP
jgi:hypothetical protein